MKSINKSRFAAWHAALPITAGLFAVALPAAAFSSTISIQGVLPVAADQPQINAVIRTSAASGTELTTSGGYYTIQAFLDSGTSGILLSQSTWTGLGVNQSTTVGSSSSPVVFNDVAIGGTNPYYVSTPYYVATAPFSINTDQTLGGTPPPVSAFGNTIGPVQMELSETANPLSQLTGSIDIMGAPVMQGNVTEMDIAPANSISSLTNPGETQTYIYSPGTHYNPTQINTNPGIVPMQYHVQLSYASFAQFTSVTPTGATGPTLADNPFIGANPVAAFNGTPTTNSPPGVTIGFNGQSATGSFLLDTGAVASFISQAMAGKLGVAYAAGTYGTSNPSLISSATGKPLANQFTLAVSGAGGSTVTAAGFFLNTLSLQTMEGTTITFDSAPVLVQDVTVTDPTTLKTMTLDGDLGMNFFEPSASADLSQMNSSAFNWMSIDQPNSLLGLTLASSVPEPAALMLMAAAAPLLLLQRRRAI